MSLFKSWPGLVRNVCIIGSHHSPRRSSLSEHSKTVHFAKCWKWVQGTLISLHSTVPSFADARWDGAPFKRVFVWPGSGVV